jgi:hypothetical protein
MLESRIIDNANEWLMMLYNHNYTLYHLSSNPITRRRRPYAVDVACTTSLGLNFKIPVSLADRAYSVSPMRRVAH